MHQSVARQSAQCGGFTLPELLVVLSISAILMALAIPSFSRLIQSSTVSTTANILLADLRYARSEAIRRGGGVTLCRSDAPEANHPVCSSESSGADGRGWADGWIVFQDWNGNDVQDDVEPMLRVQSALTQMDAISEAGDSATVFRFTATGRTSITNAMLHIGGSRFATDVQRLVCVNVGGRARLASAAAVDCDGQ
jgi:type IV fimbrial biogenesis protein FimT